MSNLYEKTVVYVDRESKYMLVFEAKLYSEFVQVNPKRRQKFLFFFPPRVSLQMIFSEFTKIYIYFLYYVFHLLFPSFFLSGSFRRMWIFQRERQNDEKKKQKRRKSRESHR